MLDIKRIRENKEEIKDLMRNRGESVDLTDFDKVVDLDEERRETLVEVEAAKAKKNQVSAMIPQRKKAGEDVTDVMNEMKELGETIKDLDNKVKEIDAKIEYIMLRLPNIPHASVPDGNTDDDNVEMKKWGEIRNFGFTPKAHWDLGTDLDILDFEPKNV